MNSKCTKTFLNVCEICYQHIFSVHPVLPARDGYASPGVRGSSCSRQRTAWLFGAPNCTQRLHAGALSAAHASGAAHAAARPHGSVRSREGQRQRLQQTSHSVALWGALRGPASTSPLHAALGSGHGQSLQPRRAVTAVGHGGQGHVQTGSRTVTNRAHGAEPLCGPWLHCLPPYTFQWPK